MHGLAILFITLALPPISMVKASDGISGSRISLMRTGSWVPSPLDTFNRVCRNMVSARIAETIREEANPEKAARMATRIRTFIPSEEFEASEQENPESILPRIQTAQFKLSNLSFLTLFDIQCPNNYFYVQDLL